jgi:hypothetical protein
MGGGADRLPPAAEGGHRECGGVVVGADADPAGVGGHVVDAVRVGLAQRRVEEVVHLDLLGPALRVPFPAAVVVRADEFLLRGVHADHRVTGGQVRLGLIVEVAELGVAVVMLGAVAGLGVGLQAVAQLAQQPAHHEVADRMPALGQRLGQ